MVVVVVVLVLVVVAMIIIFMALLLAVVEKDSEMVADVSAGDGVRRGSLLQLMMLLQLLLL